MRGVTVVIDPRFNGPPDSGHGGYSAGCAAAQLDAPAVEVTLRRPPPLAVPLDVVRTDAGVELRHADDLVAEARPVALGVAGPPPVAAGQAAAASERFAWADDHPFPSCFGCGPDRAPGDALCLATGAVGAGGLDGRRHRRPAVRVGGARLPELRAGASDDRGAGRARAIHGGDRAAGRGRRAA